MKTNDIIAAMRCCVASQHTGCKECPAYCRSANCLNRLHTAAADTIEAQQKRIEELGAECRWIPVTERMPKPFESVLALIPSEAPLPTVHESYIADHDEWVCILTVERYKPGEVTHWMPMPEMMKEGNKNG